MLRRATADRGHGARARARVRWIAAATVAVLAGVGALVACGGSEASDRDRAADRPTLPGSEFGRLLHRYVGKPGDAVGLIALVRTPTGTWRGAAGRADLSTGRAMTTDDRVRVGSVTKTFTATVLLQLVEEHRLALDDTVAQRFPVGFREGEQITLEQLLDHTSGIRSDRPEEFPAFAKVIPLIRDAGLRRQAAELSRRKARGEDVVAPARVWVAAAATQPPLFTPGSQFRYSNINYALLGKIIERRTGRTLADEMAARVFRPLHLNRTTLATTTSIPGAHAHGYVIGSGTPVDTTTTADDLRSGLGAGDGAIVSTVDDIARFYAALLGGRLVPRAQLAKMLKPTPTPPLWGDIPTSGYGLGVTRFRLPCGEAWGHGGGMDGYLTQVLSDRSGRHVVVVAVNSTGANSAAAKTHLTVDLYCRAVGRSHATH
jgi:CubicO group peptidase (beta-lactamase class C family)